MSRIPRTVAHQHIDYDFAKRGFFRVTLLATGPPTQSAKNSNQKTAKNTQIIKAARKVAHYSFGETKIKLSSPSLKTVGRKEMATVQKCRQKQLVFVWYRQASLRINQTAICIDDKVPSLVNEYFQHVFRRFKVQSFGAQMYKEEEEKKIKMVVLVVTYWRSPEQSPGGFAHVIRAWMGFNGYSSVHSVHSRRFKKRKKKNFKKKRFTRSTLDFRRFWPDKRLGLMTTDDVYFYFYFFFFANVADSTINKFQMSIQTGWPVVIFKSTLIFVQE